MKKEIEILKKQHGTYTAVAKSLGITYRHLINIRSGMKPSKHLEILIGQMAGRCSK